MKVFLTGATGFVGKEILRQLHESGHAARLLVRNRESRRVQELVSRYKSEEHVGDILDADSLEGAIEGVDAVIHLVGIISELGHNTFERVHARGTRHVTEATRRAGVKRFVHMSALGTRSDAVSRYHQTKWAAEETVRRSGLEYTIFRPSVIYGPGDRFVNLFERLSWFSPVLPVMGSDQAKFQPVSVEVVATAFIKALSEPKSIGQAYDLCGPEPLTFAALLADILAVQRRRRLKLRVPPALARGQAAFLELIYPLLFRKPPPLTRDQLIMLDEGSVGNPKPAEELFGLKQPTFREGVQASVAGKG
ncbi:MAG TPA: complex I NDUFA9 subunit family protein [Candidatus Acidoferrum sp.]|jgi:uncharacterized protein YbjT (DUF2867 family)|nr:complex I NDUFA9 subunit family protein [Candidatus Acidoferrum sp.]